MLMRKWAGFVFQHGGISLILKMCGFLSWLLFIQVPFCLPTEWFSGKCVPTRRSFSWHFGVILHFHDGGEEG